MLQNPFWYAGLAHAADVINQEHGGNSSKELPMALAGAFPCVQLQEALADGVPRCLADAWIRSIEATQPIQQAPAC